MLQANISDNELRLYVENGLNHFDDLFRMKADAAKVDVFYLMSGMWRTPVERFFLWIGGFRPSEILKVSLQNLCYHPLRYSHYSQGEMYAILPLLK